MQQCILSFNNREEVLELPVPLQEWSLEEPHNTYEFNTMDTGEVLAIGSKKLDTLTIDSFFPATKDYTFLYNKEFPDPWACVEMIRRWKKSKRPIRVIVVGTDINHAMAISNFTHGKGDNTNDVFFVLELIEYSFLNTERSKRDSGDKEELKERQEEKTNKPVSTHVVKAGDTLWDLSEKFLGGGENWKEIADLNGITDPRTLQIGQELKIPNKQAEAMQTLKTTIKTTVNAVGEVGKKIREIFLP